MKQTRNLLVSVACIAGALAFAVATSQAASNLLVDPGFESGAPGQPNPIPIPGGAGGGWAVFGGATYSQAHPEFGSWGIQEMQGIGQAWNFEAPYQVIGGVSAGQKFTLTGDFMTTTGNSQAPGGYVPVVIQMTFFNASGTDLGTVETGGVGAKAVQYNMGALNTWVTGTVTATAPAGAAYVGPYLAFMENGSQTAADTLYWDNASLTLVVPEPSSLALLGLGLAGTFIWRRRQ
jgi:PEP-CTERM motif